MHVVPATQVPLPVQFSPAHWPHFAIVPPVLVAAVLDVMETFVVEDVDFTELVDVLFEVVDTEPPLLETLKMAIS